MTKRFLLIAALALAVRAWVVYSEPLPISGDEIAHGNYVGYVREHYSLPDSAVSGMFLPPGRDGLMQMSYEFYQPPGYYVLAAFLGGGNPMGTRFVSVVMFMISLCFLWAASKDTVIACALCFIPGVIVTTSTIGNDVFLLMGSAIILFGCLRRRLWAFGLGALVLATAKLHGVVILTAMGIFYLTKDQRKWAVIALTSAFVGALIVWWRWEMQTVNDPTLTLLKPTLLNVANVLGMTLGTGVMHPVTDRIQPPPFVLGVIAGIALVAGAYIRVKRRGLPTLHLLVIASVILVWAGFSFTHRYCHGRLLYAAIPWLALAQESATVARQRGGKPTKRKEGSTLPDR